MLLEESHTVPQVIALYRYPVQGLHTRSVQAMTILPGGRVAGDRVLHFRFADAPVADDAWCRKSHGVVLANTPAWRGYTCATMHTRVGCVWRREAQLLADEALDAAGRARLVGALTSYVQSLAENPLTDHPERLPVKLVVMVSPALSGQTWQGRPPCTAVRAWRPRASPSARLRSTKCAFGTTS